jgi:hypothetical protein
MKKSLFFGAAVAALSIAGAAHAQSGHIDLSYQNTSRDGSSVDIDSTALSGAVLFSDHVQVNAHYASVDTNNGTADDFSIDGFLFNRSDSGAYGAYLGYDYFDYYSGADTWAVGGFLQHYSGNVTWTGQLGYANTDGDNTNINLDGEARWFASDNFSLQANLGYGNYDTSSSGDYWSGGLGAEVAIGSSPFSLYGGWEHYEFDNGNGSDTLGAGIRWNFGGGTLLERDRSGASFQRQTRSLVDLEFGGAFIPRD